MAERPDLDELLGPARNFGLSQAERVRALGGLPAHLRRLGRIEQLHDRAKLIASRVRVGQERPEALEALVQAVNVLIDAHNRYFPIEANLPIDPRSGRPLHGDGPFQPRPLLALATLLR
jgi:hypothetical protein